MKTKRINNLKLGLFVLSGIIFLIFTLYMIGKNRNLLGSTFTIKAIASNVNGLVPGNNVRFKGIDVGTVKSIEVNSDTTIAITLTIDENIKPFLRKGAIASIGTDGLMGNKLININAQPGTGAQIEDGDIIFCKKPIETDEMLRTLNNTNTNIEKISDNLYDVSVKLNRSESLWSLLSDTAISEDLKVAIMNLKNAGSNTVSFTDDAKDLIQKFDKGEGIAHRLFMDTTLANQLTMSVKHIQSASKNTSGVASDLKQIMNDMNDGEGTAGLILKDTTFREKLQRSATNIEEGTDRFNQNMEALKSNFLFRRYFKKKAKQQRQNINASTN